MIFEISEQWWKSFAMSRCLEVLMDALVVSLAAQRPQVLLCLWPLLPALMNPFSLLSRPRPFISTPP